MFTSVLEKLLSKKYLIFRNAFLTKLKCKRSLKLLETFLIIWDDTLCVSLGAS